MKRRTPLYALYAADAISLSGNAVAQLAIPWYVLVTTGSAAPKDLRGRIFGAVRAGAWASIPLGVLLGGVIVGTIGVAATFLAIGVFFSLVVAYGFYNPAFRAMDHAEEAP